MYIYVHVCLYKYSVHVYFARKQAAFWAEGDSDRAREMSKLQYKSDKTGKVEKLAKAAKLEKQAWIEKMERQEKLRNVRMMDPLEAHMLSKITAGVDTMIMTGKQVRRVEGCEWVSEGWRCELVTEWGSEGGGVGEWVSEGGSVS